MAHRVLVVDDVAEVRVLIRCMLVAGGYEVDEASTLAEARAKDAGRYDAVLVDATLGPERGIDLVEELRSQDPAAAGRCLVITGGVVGTLPEGVACLAKPFRRGQLLDAVRALHQPVVAALDREEGAIPAWRPRSAPPAVPGRDQHASGQPRSWQVLSITRRLRARERHELADFLHDAPIQELTAAALELQMMLRWAPPSQAASLDSALRRLDAASKSLRWLVDGEWPFARPVTDLAATVRQQTAWLLAAPITVDTDGQPESLRPIEIPIIADAVELLLHAMVPAGLMTRARVAAQSDEAAIRIELSLTPKADDQALGDPAAAGESLEALASALAASVRTELSGRQWRVQLVLRRRAE